MKRDFKWLEQQIVGEVQRITSAGGSPRSGQAAQIIDEGLVRQLSDDALHRLDELAVQRKTISEWHDAGVLARLELARRARRRNRRMEALGWVTLVAALVGAVATLLS